MNSRILIPTVFVVLVGGGVLFYTNFLLKGQRAIYIHRSLSHGLELFMDD